MNYSIFFVLGILCRPCFHKIYRSRRLYLSAKIRAAEREGLYLPLSIYFMKQFLISLTLLLIVSVAAAQYAQQEVKYKMDIVLDDSNHRYKGTQRLVYKNNSSETLDKVYYHLFFNAFQPGSMMDVRSRTLPDPDPRVGDRISKLSPGEQGYLRVISLEQNGRPVDFQENGTILEVTLDKPLKPGRRAKFDMEFEGQVPVTVRRAGRDNKEGVAYSMAQWYPKICEFDRHGWHAYPYIGREFHGVWGSFDVRIVLDSAYTVAATGTLENAQRVGKGYLPEGKKLKRSSGGMLSWRFKADRVHDFAWAADKEYVHVTRQIEDGPMLRFFFKDSPDLHRNWDRLPEYTEKIFRYAEENFGEYSYPSYSVVQGGDGGMEYPMLTFITGQRKFSSLVGVTVHEVMHSWYQLMLGTNEALYPWMDEGFTTFTGSKVMSHLFNPEEDTRRGRYYDGYISLALSGAEEPMSKHADHYNTNYAYGAASYSKGAVFLAQLGYVLGDEVMKRGLREYYDTWRFKHPDPVDFIRVMERVSGTHLGWYLNYMMNTTETIDYAVDEVAAEGDKTRIVLRRIGNFPMPVDVDVTMKDGSKMRVHIPLRIMRNAKEAEDEMPFIIAEDWPWTHPVYELIQDVPFENVAKVEIDESLRLADVDRNNNVYENAPAEAERED